MQRRGPWCTRLGLLGSALVLGGAAVAGTVGAAAVGAQAAGAATDLTMVYSVPVFGGYSTQPLVITDTAPAMVAEGAQFTSTITPAATVVPTTQTIGPLSATLSSIQGITTIIPLPANATYVSSSTSGDATYSGPSNGSVPVTVTECTSASQSGCIATPTGKTFGGSTSLPYLQISTPGAVPQGTTPTPDTANEFPAGTTITMPSVTLVMQATGVAGSTIQPAVSEFSTTANVTKPLTISAAIYAWPTSDATASPPPNAVTPLATTTILAPPTVSGISPASGTTAGGTAVTITGTGFVAPATVSFGGTSATNVSVVSPTEITADAPAGTAGGVNVMVTDPGGTSGPVSFTYVTPPTPPPTPITPVTPVTPVIKPLTPLQPAPTKVAPTAAKILTGPPQAPLGHSGDLPIGLAIGAAGLAGLAVEEVIRRRRRSLA